MINHFKLVYLIPVGLRNMVVSCNTCGRGINKRGQGVQCGKCSLSFHTLCAKINDHQYQVLQSDFIIWHCEKCRAEHPSDTRTPLTSFEQLSGNLESIPWFETLKTKILTEINSKFDAILKSVTFCSDKISDFELKMNQMNEKIKTIDNLQKENLDLKNKIATLDMRVNDMEQYSKLNNLIIHNIPESRSENVLDVVKTIADRIGVPINSDEIDMAHRLKSNSTSNTSRPKNIVVKFISRLTKERFLTSFRQNKNFSTSNLNIAGPDQQIFINEHLSQFNNQLFKDARHKLKQNGFKYVWTKNCRIFARKEDTSRIKSIQCTGDIEKLY